MKPLKVDENKMSSACAAEMERLKGLNRWADQIETTATPIFYGAVYPHKQRVEDYVAETKMRVELAMAVLRAEYDEAMAAVQKRLEQMSVCGETVHRNILQPFQQATARAVKQIEKRCAASWDVFKHARDAVVKAESGHKIDNYKAVRATLKAVNTAKKLALADPRYHAVLDQCEIAYESIKRGLTSKNMDAYHKATGATVKACLQAADIVKQVLNDFPAPFRKAEAAAVTVVNHFMLAQVIPELQKLADTKTELREKVKRDLSVHLLKLKNKEAEAWASPCGVAVQELSAAYKNLMELVEKVRLGYEDVDLAAAADAFRATVRRIAEQVCAPLDELHAMCLKPETNSPKSQNENTI